MFDFLKKPIVIVFVLIAIVIALIWSSISNWQTNRQKTETTSQESSKTTTIINLANVDASEFDDQLKNELLDVMTEEGLGSTTDGNITASLKDEYTRFSVDATRLKKENPAVWKEFVKKTKLKPSLMITKNKKD